MKVFLIKTHLKIEPFDDYIQDSLIQNIPLRDIQRDVFEQLRVNIEYIEKNELKDISYEDRLIIYDNIFFTKEFLQYFFKQIKRKTHPVQCAINKKEFDPIVSVDNYTNLKEYNLLPIYFYPKQYKISDSVELIKIDNLTEYNIDYKIPRFLHNQDTARYLFTNKIAIEIKNWPDLVNGNTFANRSLVMKLKKSFFKILKGIILSFSFNEHKIAAKANTIGQNCDIHPSAVLEGCIIGNNVTIMANCHLLFSTVGDNTTISSGSVIQFCSIGSTCLLINPALAYTTMYSGSFIAKSTAIATLIGSGVQITMNVTISDSKFDGGPISIKIGKKNIPTDFRWLGVCLGHNSRIATGVKLMEGLSIPNNYEIHLSDHLTFIPENMPINTPLFVHNKTLRHIPLLSKFQNVTKQEESL